MNLLSQARSGQARIELADTLTGQRKDLNGKGVGVYVIGSKPWCQWRYYPRLSHSDVSLLYATPGSHDKELFQNSY